MITRVVKVVYPAGVVTTLQAQRKKHEAQADKTTNNE